MKSLLEFITESSDSQFFRFIFKGWDDKDKIVKSIESVGSQTGVYTERIDYGIKIKLTDENKSKAEKFIDVINSNIESKEDSEVLEKIKNELNKMKEFSEKEDDGE